MVATAWAMNILIKLSGDFKENAMWSFLMTLSMTISNYAHYWPNKNSMRIFVAAICLYGLNINAAYRSSLIKVLTEPRFEPQISTVHEALSNDFTFTGGENTLEFLAGGDEVRKLERSFFKSEEILLNRHLDSLVQFLNRLEI